MLLLFDRLYRTNQKPYWHKHETDIKIPDSFIPIPCDNSQFCHWSMLVLAERHVSVTTGLKHQGGKLGDTTTHVVIIIATTKYYAFVLLETN